MELLVSVRASRASSSWARGAEEPCASWLASGSGDVSSLAVS